MDHYSFHNETQTENVLSFDNWTQTDAPTDEEMTILQKLIR